MSPRSIQKQPNLLLFTSPAFIVLLTCWSVHAAQAAPSVMTSASAGKSYQQIVALRKAKLYRQAQRAAQSLIARRPQDAQAHVAMAEVLRDTGRTPEALKEYTRAFHLKPNMVEALVPLCELRLKGADRELGLSYARMAVLAAPNSDKVRLTLIEALIATDRLEEAEKELAPRLAGASPETLVLAYQLSRKKRDLSAAGRYLDEAIRKSPRNTNLLLLKCDLLEAVDDNAGALEALKRAVALEPKSTDVRLRLASHLENHQRDFPRAVNEYRAILELDPDCVSAVCGIARCESKSKDATLQIQIMVEKKVASLFNSKH